MTGNLDTEGPHWQFALAVYAAPGVAPACLFLQDEYRLDVNLLLVGLYAATVLEWPLDADAISALDQDVTPWRTHVVEPLRGVRRYIKEVGASPAAEEVRQSVKGAELAAEQIAQAVLMRTLTARGPASGVKPDLEESGLMILREALRRSRPGETVSPPARQALRSVAAAARRYADHLRRPPPAP